MCSDLKSDFNVEQSGLRKKVVPKLVCAGPEAPVSSARRQQGEQIVIRVAGITDDLPGNTTGSSHNLLQCFAVASGAVSIPGSNAAS